MSSTSSVFRFEEFAKDIYREIPNAHRQPFLLPALYGGDCAAEYEALFVLEAPSVSFTEDHWRQRSTPEPEDANGAIKNHRRIFLEWAYNGKQAYLFKSLFMTSSADFYRRFYVTDVWKDAAFRERSGDLKYSEYWLAKLAVELQHVSTRHVIFVGKEAALAGWPFIKNRAVFKHKIPFPSQWISNEQFKGYVDTLAQELRKGDATSTAVVTPPAAANTATTRPDRHANSMHGGDRDALWHEAFSPASPPKSAGVLAAHPDAVARTARLVTSLTARRVVAIANAMHNSCRPTPLRWRQPALPPAKRRGPSFCRAATRPTCRLGPSGSD
jgi:hypothetical protein